MLELSLNQSPEPKKPVLLDAHSLVNISQGIEDLHRSDRSLDNLIGMEVWAIAKTMDDLYPGFWHQFMINRRQAMKQFMQQKQHPGLKDPGLITKSD